MKQYSIVGMEHQKATDFLKALATGAPAVLIREPDNEFDRNAIAVWIEGRKVGYIPKKQNVALAAFIDQTGICDSTSRAGELIAMDQDPATSRAIDAKFFKSPNSGYPMVEV